jgi:hypothetical protein
MRINNTVKFIINILILTQVIIIASAQNMKAEKHYVNNSKHWLAEVPIWIPGFRGQLAYGDIDFSSSGTEKERDFKRINSDLGLEFYFVGRITAQYKKIWLQVDAFSGEVGSAFTYTPSNNNNNETEIVNIKIQGTIPKLVIGYSIWEKLIKDEVRINVTPYLGIRHIRFHLQSNVLDSLNIINKDPSWFEPVIGLYIPIIYKRFKIEIQADFGTNGTKNSWGISNRYRYQLSKLIDLQLGWNIIHLYHNSIVDDIKLETTIRLFGPTAGVGFRF